MAGMETQLEFPYEVTSPAAYVTLDSGQRVEFASGMTRDVQDGKPRFDLLIPEGVPYDAQVLTRFAALMTRGAEKYQARNWEQASGTEDLKRFKQSAFRHFMQWFCELDGEDHMAAVLFNLMGYETTKWKLDTHDGYTSGLSGAEPS